MAKEKIIVGIDDTAVELKGAELDAFLADRNERQSAEEALKAKDLARKQLKIEAYTKLGLTEEEINAIL
jgi:hypothetical protein